MFLYNPFDFYLNNPEQLKLKIFYYSLEMDKESKMIQGMGRYLYKISNGLIRTDINQLQSIGKNRLSEEIYQKIVETRSYFDELDKILTISDDSHNPYGIFKDIDDYAKSNGTIVKKKLTFKEKQEDGTFIDVEREVFDHYIPDHPNEYVIIIIDHIGLVTPLKGTDVKTTIEKVSSDMRVLRNKYGYIPAPIQQMAAAQEGLAQFKASKLEPTMNGLAESKLTARDCDVMLGLFSPYRHEIESYRGYRIPILGDNFRNLSVVKNRYGNNGVNVGLYFDGAVNYFEELPKANDMTNDIYEMYTSKIKN